MTIIVRHITDRVECDATGCRNWLSLDPQSPAWSDTVKRAMLAAGWTIWHGRSTRHYCPHHEPAPGHRMHQVTK